MMVKGDPSMLPKIERAIRSVITPPRQIGTNDTVPFRVQWTRIGYENEHEAMHKEFPSVEHRVFSRLDARRYSMYYNRYKSYQQVEAYEREVLEDGERFDWVIHARMDALWGEPIQPVDYWTSLSKPYTPEAMMWVADTWWCEVPDTFALLPRDLATNFFSLESLVATGVMCLGGPNVHPNITQLHYLQSLSLSPGEISTAVARACPSFDDGMSERILKRKLQFHGIDLSKGNLKYTTFFMVIVRPNMQDICFFLEDKRMIGWIIDSQYGNRIVSFACLYMVSRLKEDMLWRKHMEDVHASLYGQLTKRYVGTRTLPMYGKHGPSIGNRKPSGLPWPTTVLDLGPRCVWDMSRQVYLGKLCPLNAHVTDWYVRGETYSQLSFP